MKRKIIYLSILILVLILMYALYSVRVTIPVPSENAVQIEYKDITTEYFEISRFGIRDLLMNKVDILYIDGHTSDNTLIKFKNCKPYETFEVYLIEDTLVLFYNEKKEGNRQDRYFSIDGRPGFENGDNIQVIKNDKSIFNIIVGYGIE
ncbi:MAG: hypothetical protein JEZ08_20835 [Clostridiales bacterium]|nr:hypothetical protein [Clostridiales bacterium]